MIDSNVINLMLNSLESTDREIKSALDELVKFIVNITRESEDLRDELALYEDLIFHIYIHDIDYNIWIKKTDASITYNTSFYENVPEEMKIIHYILSRKTIIRIFTQRLDPTDAYMKGLVKIQGNLSDGLITRNLLTIFFDYINHFLTHR